MKSSQSVLDNEVYKIKPQGRQNTKGRYRESSTGQPILEFRSEISKTKHLVESTYEDRKPGTVAHACNPSS
jgi:hypothetical protein